MEMGDIDEDLLDELDELEQTVPAPPVKPTPTRKPTKSNRSYQPPPAHSWSRTRTFRDRQLPNLEEITSSVERLNSNNKTSKLPSVVTLNVGGVYFTTLRSTLLRFPDSMLAAMFSGRHEPVLDHRGAHFIDRNGTYFGYILEFLRTDMLPPSDVAIGVVMEARYYALDELEDRMNVIPSIAAQIVKENHRAQFPEYQENKKRIIQIAMENATVSKIGEVLIYAYRTEFIPKAQNFNINHHCAADQAHISIGPWESIADEEMLIKCIESDLIDEQFNVKLHDGKRRCKYFYGQSCQKCIFRIQVMFE